MVCSCPFGQNFTNIRIIFLFYLKHELTIFAPETISGQYLIRQ